MWDLTHLFSFAATLVIGFLAGFGWGCNLGSKLVRPRPNECRKKVPPKLREEFVNTPRRPIPPPSPPPPRSMGFSMGDATVDPIVLRAAQRLAREEARRLEVEAQTLLAAGVSKDDIIQIRLGDNVPHVVDINTLGSEARKVLGR